MNENKFQNIYREIWENKINDFLRCNEKEQIIKVLEKEANYYINRLNNPYDYFNIYKMMWDETTKTEYILLVELFTELLNNLVDAEHQCFNGKLQNKNVYCESDKFVNYRFIKQSENSSFYVLLHDVVSYDNYKINCKIVNPYFWDSLYNIYQ